MKVKVVNKSDYPLPKYQTLSSAGVDLVANINEALKLEPMARELVPTGLFMALPEGTELQIRPRSGLALKHGITVCNTPGTVDADYRNEVKVILINLSNEAYTIQPGERIAQAVLNAYARIDWEEVDTLEETDRKGGFGSTGK
jgi:dUTP pyrophosphatase